MPAGFCFFLSYLPGRPLFPQHYSTLPFFFHVEPLATGDEHYVYERGFFSLVWMGWVRSNVECRVDVFVVVGSMDSQIQL